MSASDSAKPVAAPENGHAVRLVPPEDVRHLHEAWLEVQTRFVDDPREAVQGADQLVATVMQSLARRKRELEAQWRNDSEVETEDLRITLQRYRTFFHQLISTAR